MGLISIGLAAARTIGGALGIGGGAAAATTAVRTAAPTILSRVGRALLSPFATSVAGGAAGVGLAGGFGGGVAQGVVPTIQRAGGGMGMSVALQIESAGGTITELSGGRFAGTLPNGDFQVFNRDGNPVRATQIIQAGTRMPGGGTIVSVRQGGTLIGITRRKPRKRFGAEIRNVKRVVRDAQALTNLCRPKTRRS